MSVLVYDLAASSENPHAVLTGDTLFIGDVGRPDLLASIGVTADELADMLYDSLHEKILSRCPMKPSSIRLMCRIDVRQESLRRGVFDDRRAAEIQLRTAAITSREAFKAIVTTSLTPSYFVHDAIYNRQERSSLDEKLEQSLVPLTSTRCCVAEKRGSNW
ncbi:MAG: hypothetical protein R3B96_23175 [Pirellulaceae bacterium]